MGALTNLARRWADTKLSKEADELRFRLVTADAAVERLTQERDKARESIAKSIATNDRLLAAYDGQANELDKARREFAKLHTRTDEAERQVRGLRAELAEQSAQNVILADANRHLEAKLSDREGELRQEKRARERAEQHAAEAVVTVDELTSAMARLESEGRS